MRHVQQFAAGKDVALDELADAGAELALRVPPAVMPWFISSPPGLSRRRILSK